MGPSFFFTHVLFVMLSQWRPESDEARERLILKQGDAAVFYDLRTGEFLQENLIDVRTQKVIPRPGMNLWWGHPEKQLMLEEIFEDYLKEIGWRLKWSRAVKKADEEFGYRTFTHREWFELAVREKGVTDSGKALMSSIEASVVATRSRLLSLLDVQGLRWVKGQLEQNDILEPFHSQVSHSENRFDAFVLSSLRAFFDRPSEFLHALKNLASSQPRFPLEWMAATRNLYSFEVREAILTLMTHNHAAEKFLIQAVALEEGLERAWKVLQDLNTIYLGERDFWLKSAQPSKRWTVEFPTGIAFFDRDQTIEIPIRSSELIFGPLIGFRSDEKLQPDDWVPFFQRYHMYGAWLAANRLQRRLGLSDRDTKRVSLALGLSYKLKTMGFNRQQLKKMNLFYSHGAEIYFLMSHLIDSEINRDR